MKQYYNLNHKIVPYCTATVAKFTTDYCHNLQKLHLYENGTGVMN